jgi:hypothetical protein
MEREAQPCSGQSRVFPRICRYVLLAVEQSQSAVQFLGEDGDLELVGIRHPAVERMRRQTASVLGSMMRLSAAARLL